MIKHILPLFLFCIALSHLNAQELDLIVRTNGDSIACRIDSISETALYFEMISQNRWIHTLLDKEYIVKYERRVIDKESISFRPGTSIITYTRDSDKPEKTIRKIRKNTIFYELGSLIWYPSVNFDRIIPFSNYTAVSVRVGFHRHKLGLLGELGFLAGSKNHLLEFGVGYGANSPSLRAGYRYQGNRGLVIKAGPNWVYREVRDGYIFNVVPSISIGYSFNLDNSTDN